MSEWADRFRVVPKGPASGKWRNATMPLLTGIMDAICDTKYDLVVVTGPRQSGKTEAAIINPFLYYCMYLGKDCLILYPDLNTAKEKYSNVIYPAVKAQPELAMLDLPKDQRGKLVSGRRWAHGAALYMSGAGSVAALQSRTIEVILMDEVDFMKPMKVSKGEYRDPVDDAIGRADAFPSTSRFVLSCTVTGFDGAVWRYFLSGNRMVPFVPCPHCGRFILMQQDYELEKALGMEVDGDAPGGLRFDDTTKSKARKTAHYICNECAEPIYNQHRIDMLRNYKWIPLNPEVEDTASFWYNRFVVPFWSFGDIATRYLTAQETSARQRDYQQHTLTIPWKDPDVEVIKIEDKMVQEHTSYFDKGEAPDGPDVFVLSSDVHRRVIYYMLMGFSRENGTPYLIDEDHLEVFSPENLPRAITKVEGDAIFQALLDLYETITHGWPRGGEENPSVFPSAVGVDHGYAPDVVERFCAQAGQRKFNPMKGWSTSNNEKFKHPGRRRREAGISTPHVYSSVLPSGSRLLHFNADWGKRAVHRALSIPVGVPGAMLIHKEMRPAFARHLRAERFEINEDGGRWIKTRKDNHYLDCASMCFALAESLGVKFSAGNVQKKNDPAAGAQPPPPRRRRKLGPPQGGRKIDFRRLGGRR